MSPGEAGWILGFDVGGTKTVALAGTRDARVIDRAAFPSKAERGFEPMWQDMVAAGQSLVEKHGRPAAIGVSIGGPLDYERGIILSPPNLPGWDAIPLKDMLQESFGVPAYVEHDAKAGALAEWLFGAALGKRNVVFLTFSTGMGAGLIFDGRLHHGAAGLAGEVGHWRVAEDGPLIYGKRGSWEGYSSGVGMAALAASLYPGAYPPDVSAADLTVAARAGDERARRIVELTATYLGRGIALLIDLLNPEMIVLGSMAVRSGDLFLPLARQVAAAESLDNGRGCEIVPAALGEGIGDAAALCVAIYYGGMS